MKRTTRMFTKQTSFKPSYFLKPIFSQHHKGDHHGRRGNGDDLQSFDPIKIVYLLELTTTGSSPALPIQRVWELYHLLFNSTQTTSGQPLLLSAADMPWNHHHKTSATFGQPPAPVRCGHSRPHSTLFRQVGCSEYTAT